MNNDEPVLAGAAAQAGLVRTGAVSARELVASTLRRIDRLDGELGSYRVVLADEALGDAGAIDDRPIRDDPRPLLGVPVAIKDNVDVAGHTTMWGARLDRARATDDAPVVAALRRAGAIVIGKTNCSEISTWPFTETVWGATRNPWDAEYSPGGSSGGSGAAVAAGLCGLGLGSDGLGSIRVPASFCGVFGLKPQRGRVWHSPTDWYSMSVNGPISRHVADSALLLDAVAPSGQSFAASANGDPRPLRIGVAWRSAALWPMAARLGHAQRAAVHGTAALLRDLGHQVVESEVGFGWATSNAYLFRYLKGVEEDLGTLEDREQISGRTLTMGRFGRAVPHRLIEWSRRVESALAVHLGELFDDVDVVLTPGPVQAPTRIGRLDGRGAVRTLYTSGRRIPHFAPWNLVGFPASAIPAGFDDDGLPIAVQLAGPADSEHTLLSLAGQIERARPWPFPAGR